MSHRDVIRRIDRARRNLATLREQCQRDIPSSQQELLRIVRDDLEDMRGEVAVKQEMLSAMVDATDAQVAYLDRDFNFVYVNQAYARGSGYDREYLIGKNHFDLFPHAENRKIFERVRDTGEPYRVTNKPFVYLDRPQLGVTYWDWTLIPVKRSQGEVEGVVLSLFDVTDRVRSATKLQQREQEFRNLVEGSPDIVARLDSHLCLTYANPTIERIWGGHTSDYVGRSLSELGFPEQMAAQWAAEITSVLQAGEGKTLQVDVSTPQGRRTLDVRLAPELGPDGTVVSVLAVACDVTAHEQARIELAAERAELEAIFRHAPQGIVVTDANGRVVRVNQAFQEIVKRPVPEGLDPTDWPEIRYLHPDGEPYEQGDIPLVRSALDGEAHRDMEMRLDLRDGRKVDLLASTAPIRDERGRLIGTVGIVQDISERKEAEEQLERQATLLNRVSDAIVSTDLEFRVQSWNKAAERIFGFTADEVMGKPLGEILFTRYADDTDAHVMYDFFRSGYWEGEVLQQRRDGIWLNMHSSATMIYDEAGKPVGTVSVSRDISERKHAEEALKRYANRLELLNKMDQAILVAESIEESAGTVLEYLPQLIPCQWIGIMLIDMEARAASLVAPNYARRTAFTMASKGPLTWAWFVPEMTGGEILVRADDLEDAAKVSPWAEALRGAGIRCVVAVPIRASAGLNGALLVGMSGPDRLSQEHIQILRELADQLAVGIEKARLEEQLRGHAANLEEIVARRTAALQATEARFRSLFEESPVGMMLLHQDGRIMLHNAAMLDMLGYDRQEFRDKRLEDLSYPEDVHVDAGLFAEVAAGELANYQVDKRYQRRDGEAIWVRLTATAVRRAATPSSQVILIVEDITEQRKAQEALVQSEKLNLTGMMAASLAHEINNPLQSVLGCLGLAEEVLDREGDPRRYLRVARDELRRAASIVTRLRDINRPSTPADRVSSDMNELIGRVRVLSEKTARDAGVPVTWDLSEGLPSLFLVPDRIIQVLLNLILNAIEAMPEGGELGVSTRSVADPAGVEVAFRDTGIGMEKGELSQLFTPFRTKKKNGLGLGLYVSRNIVREHGGDIMVESSPGKGSTFTVWLPT